MVGSSKKTPGTKKSRAKKLQAKKSHTIKKNEKKTKNKKTKNEKNQKKTKKIPTHARASHKNEGGTMSNHTHAEMVSRMISMSLGKEEPTREVIDWYRHARSTGNLSAWDWSAVQYALSDGNGIIEQCYQTEYNVFMLRRLVYGAYDIDPWLFEVDTETLDELREELRMISEWNDAFNEVDQDGGSFTSEEMLRAMR